MTLAFLDRHNRKRELKRLEQIKPAFLEKYRQLCAEYKAQLVPLLVPQGMGKYQLIMQLDHHDPSALKQEQVDQIAEEENGVKSKGDGQTQ